MITREVNYKDPLGLTNGADVGGVNEIDDESQAFKGHVFEETTVPQLKSRQLKPAWYVTPDVPEFCGGEDSGGTKQYIQSSA